MQEIDGKAKFKDEILAPMHTLEHLLNGSLAKLLNCSRAFTTHIEKKKSKIDIKCDRGITAEETTYLEELINNKISDNLTVTATPMAIELARETFDLSRIKDQEDISEIRIVSIGEYDHCPCCGTHVATTSQIGGRLKIISSDYNDETSTLRVRFKIVAEV